MKILVTGGAGFVGSHLVKSLLSQNQSVTILDDLSNSTAKKASELKERGAGFISGDIRDYNMLSRKIKGFDVIVHLAAKINVAESLISPEIYHHVNITGTLNLLRACVKNRVKNFVLASSAAVYGMQQKLPLRENSMVVPISPYGATKLAAENYLKAFSNSYSMNTVSLRFFNIYGMGQSFEYAGVITKFIERIRKNKPLEIYGDGKNTRDFVSIDDVVRAITMAIKKTEGKKGSVYNIASGRSVSINELGKLMISISGKRLELVHKKPTKGDIRHSRASIIMARKDLGYLPQASLRRGLEELIKMG